MPESHGQTYLAHLWERAKYALPLKTRSGLSVQAIAARATTPEAKAALNVIGRAHGLIVGVAFIQKDILLAATVLAERLDQSHEVVIQVFADGQILQIRSTHTYPPRVDWQEMEQKARDWAANL